MKKLAEISADMAYLAIKNKCALKDISYDEMLELASLGANVLHNRSVEMAKKYSTPEEVRRELSRIKSVWPELSAKLKNQLMPFDEVRAKLKAVGAPCEPEEIGVSRERFRETFAGVTYMRSRYFGLDLVARMGLEGELSASLFGPGGIWDVHVV